jgi:hypothetical protein
MDGGRRERERGSVSLSISPSSGRRERERWFVVSALLRSPMATLSFLLSLSLSLSLFLLYLLLLLRRSLLLSLSLPLSFSLSLSLSLSLFAGERKIGGIAREGGREGQFIEIERETVNRRGRGAKREREMGERVLPTIHSVHYV